MCKIDDLLRSPQRDRYNRVNDPIRKTLDTVFQKNDFPVERPKGDDF